MTPPPPQKNNNNQRFGEIPPRPPASKWGQPQRLGNGGGGGIKGFGVGVTDGHQRLVALVHHVAVQRRVQQLHGRQGIPYRAGKPLNGGGGGKGGGNDPQIRGWIYRFVCVQEEPNYGIFSPYFIPWLGCILQPQEGGSAESPNPTSWRGGGGGPNQPYFRGKTQQIGAFIAKGGFGVGGAVRQPRISHPIASHHLKSFPYFPPSIHPSPRPH